MPSIPPGTLARISAIVLLSVFISSLARAATDAPAAAVRFYGFLQGDFIYDADRVDPAWNATLRASTIPVTCPGDAGCGTRGETVFSVRQTQFGMKAAVPTDAGTVNTQIEFDLFGTGDQAGKTTPHLRHAWAEWGSWGVGQTWTLLKDGDAAPVSLNYWGPIGMMSALPPQLRWTQTLSGGRTFAVALESAGSSLDQGNVKTVFPDLNVTTKTGFPDLTAQYRHDADWGHWQTAGIVRRIDYEARTNPATPSGHVYGYGANLAGALKFGGDALLAQAAYGRGIASYFNDCCVDIGPDANLRAEAVPLFGWLLYYDHRWTSRWRSLAGYSEAVQRNTANQTGSAMHRGRYASANLLFTPAKQILIGGELLWGERRNLDGASGHDTRVQVSTQYLF